MAKPKNKDTGGLPQEESQADMTLDQAIAAVECPGVHVRRPQPGSVAERQLFHFASQPKVRYRYPRSAGDPKGAFETDCTNDLLITIEKGVSVDLPEDVAASFDASLNITDNALRKGSLKDLPEQLRN